MSLKIIRRYNIFKSKYSSMTSGNAQVTQIKCFQRQNNDLLISKLKVSK